MRFLKAVGAAVFLLLGWIIFWSAPLAEEPAVAVLMWAWGTMLILIACILGVLAFTGGGNDRT